MKVIGKVKSSAGITRKANEDVYFCSDALGLYVVCDGSEGPHGKWAAEETCRAIVKFVDSQQKAIEKNKTSRDITVRTQLLDMLNEAVQHASSSILIAKKKHPDRIDAITSLEALLVIDDFAILAHVGNSRTYKVRKGEVVQLTEDQTYFNDLTKSGMKNVNPSYHHKLSNAIGNQSMTNVYSRLYTLADGDIFILSSDGLWSRINSSELELNKQLKQIGSDSKMAENDVPEQLSKAVSELIEYAINKKAKDNITTIVISVNDRRQDKSVHSSATQINLEIDILGNIPLFRQLSERRADILAIHGLCGRKKIKSGQVIIEQGKYFYEMYIIIKGRARVLVNGEVINSIEISNGRVIGELEFFTRKASEATVVATEDMDVLCLNKEHLRSFIKKDPTSGLKIYESFCIEIVHKLKEVTDELIEIKKSSS